MTKELCFYEEGNLSIIDTASNETAKSFYQEETLNQIKQRYPKAELVPFDYALDRIDECAKEKYQLLKPIEISEEKYYEMLEVLPPDDWKTTDEGSSFKLSERTFGNITACYVVKNGKYYEVNARTNTPHNTLLAVCN